MRSSSTGKDTSGSSSIIMAIWHSSFPLCGLAFAIAGLTYNYGFSSYDDGIAAEGARLVLNGKIPYRDFWTIYGPGSYYVNALALSVFGQTILCIRAIALLMAIAQAGTIYAILRRMVSNPWCGRIACLAYLAFVPIGASGTSPITYWLTLIMIATYFLVREIEDPRPRWECLIGLVMGLATLFRQDGGFYFCGTMLLLMLATAPKIGVRRWPAICIMGGSYAFIIGLFIAYFAAKGALPAMYDDTVRFAIDVFPHTRPSPYPIPWHGLQVIGKYTAPVAVAFFYQLFTFYILPVALICLGVLFAWRLVRTKMDRSQIAATMILWLATVTFLMVRVRPSGARIAGSVILAAIALAILGSDRIKAVRISAISLLVASAIAYIPFGVYTVWAQRSYGGSVVGERAFVFAYKGHAELLSYVAKETAAMTSPTEKIISGAPVFYFMAGRDPATRYFEPHPGLTDDPRIERIIIGDMERERVRVFVRSCEWGSSSYFTMEPGNQPRILIDYIERNYHITRDYGWFAIYERRTPFNR